MKMHEFTNTMYDSGERAAFEKYVSGHYGDASGNPSFGSMSLDQFLQAAGNAARTTGSAERKPITLRGLLRLSTIRNLAEQTATKQAGAVSSQDPVLPWLWALMTWANLGQDRKWVLDRVARAHAVPVIDIFAEAGGDSSTSTFDL
jgi:hypothetical protein